MGRQPRQPDFTEALDIPEIQKMNRSIHVIALIAISATAAVAEAEGLKKATFTISGLHCPPCTRTVQASLAKMPGVKSAKVDWKMKSAKIEFDEDKTSAQQVAQGIAATPHMMGSGMRYGGRLALSVPGINDDAGAAAAEEALQQTQGVAAVVAFPVQHTVSIAFDNAGKTTIRDLVAALEKAGFKATSY